MPQEHEEHMCWRCELECDCGGIFEDCPACSLCNQEIEEEMRRFDEIEIHGDYKDEWGV